MVDITIEDLGSHLGIELFGTVSLLVLLFMDCGIPEGQHLKKICYTITIRVY